MQAASAIREALRDLDIRIRAGLHTGECEVSDGKIAGIAVSIGARISSLAAPGEVLVSSTVRDLVAGSGLQFEDRGELNSRASLTHGTSSQSPRKTTTGPMRSQLIERSLGEGLLVCASARECRPTTGRDYSSRLRLRPRRISPTTVSPVLLHEIWQVGYFRAPHVKEQTDGTSCCYLY